MKFNKIVSRMLAWAAVPAMAMLTACSPDSYEGIDYNQIPKVEDINVTVEVDQETNQYTLTLNNPGCYPVWRIYTRDTPEISTVNGVKGIIAAAGTYNVEVQMGNHHGVCEGTKVYQIKIDNSIIDYTPYIRRLTSGSSKTWRFASDMPGHLGCGEPGSDGLGWWSAQPEEKASSGMYDNRFTFTDNGTSDGGQYTFNPGDAGTIYVNTGITSLPPYSDANTNDGNDYSAPAQVQETTFTLTTEGTDMFITFPAGTLMGYVPFVEAYNSPKFKVRSMSADAIELSVDNGSIAWHYILGPEGDAPFMGFKYNSDFNLWKKATLGTPSFYYAPGWSQIANPGFEIDGSQYKISLPEATSDTWQCQVMLPTDISTSAANHYDFSCIITPTKEHKNVTVKLVKDGDDGVYYFEEHGIKIGAGEDYVFWKSDMEGLDIENLKLVLDFGGNEAGTDVVVRDVVFKNHADDDGTKLPDPEPEGPDANWGGNPNLWTGSTFSMTYFYAPGWNQIADPGFVDNGNGSYKITLPTATSDQWQAQVGFHTDMKTSADKNYDFRITLNSTTDHNGVTVKLVLDGGGDNDNVFYMADRVKLTAYDDCTFKWVNMPGIDMDKVTLMLDFGGCADNTEVVVSNIILQEHAE